MGSLGRFWLVQEGEWEGFRKGGGTGDKEGEEEGEK